jgi:hypothetical protein
VGAAASNSLASQSRSNRSHSPRGFRQLTDVPRPATFMILSLIRVSSWVCNNLYVELPSS